MIATNELLLEVMKKARLKKDHRANNYLRNPYRLPRNVSMSASHVLYDICFELVQKRLKLSRFKGYTGELRDSMNSYAMWMLQQMWHSFNPLNSDKPISYFTAIIDSALIGVLCEYRGRTNE